MITSTVLLFVGQLADCRICRSCADEPLREITIKHYNEPVGLITYETKEILIRNNQSWPNCYKWHGKVKVLASRSQSEIETSEPCLHLTTYAGDVFNGDIVNAYGPLSIIRRITVDHENITSVDFFENRTHFNFTNENGRLVCGCYLLLGTEYSFDFCYDEECFIPRRPSRPTEVIIPTTTPSAPNVTLIAANDNANIKTWLILAVILITILMIAGAIAWDLCRARSYRIKLNRNSRVSYQGAEQTVKLDDEGPQQEVIELQPIEQQP